MELSFIVNKEGNPVPVKIVDGDSGGEGGGITGRNIDNDDLINEVSFEVDADGYAVLRVVDAAPFAYDSDAGVLKVRSVRETKVVEDTRSGTLSLNASETSFIEFEPPVGKSWKINLFYFRFPAISGVTSGEHQAIVKYGGTSSSYDLMFARTSYDKVLAYRYGSFEESVDTQSPASPILQNELVKGALLVQGRKLIIAYQNRTSEAISVNYTARIIVEEENII